MKTYHNFQYHCKRCAVSFQHSRDLVKHNKALHDLILPFVCLNCGKNYAANASYKLHAKNCMSDWRMFFDPSIQGRMALTPILSQNKTTVCCVSDYGTQYYFECTNEPFQVTIDRYFPFKYELEEMRQLWKDENFTWYEPHYKR